MAIPSKKNINFDVYERQDPKTQVDWGAQASKITKTFEGIRDERQGRKDLLEKNIEEQRVALNDIGEYDSKTLRQVALDSSQQSADELARKADLMRRGILKPNDLMKFKSNQSAGWTQFKNNAENWNAKFVEYTERMQGDPPPGSQLEMQLAQSLEGFGNLKNLKFLTDDDGNMAYARTDDDGTILPGESISANEMTNLLNQKIDNYDVPKAVMSIKEELGTIITATIDPDGIRTNITTEEMSRAESNYFGSEAGQETLRLKALEMTAVPQNLAVMMTQDVRMPDGELYQGDFGGKKHDAWAAENSDKDQSLNPYIAMRFDGNRYVPDITEEQKEAGNKYAEKIIRTALDVKQTAKSQKIQKTEYQESAAAINERKSNEEIDASGKSVNMLVTGDAAAAEAAAKDLISSFENLENIERVVDANGKVIAFNIQVREPGEGGKLLQVDPIKTTDSKGNAKTPDQLNREIFKLVGAKGTYDAWYKRNKDSIGENVGEGSIVSKRAAPVIKRTIQPNEVLIPGGADGKLGRQSYTDFFASKEGGNLGNSISSDWISADYNDDIAKAFNNLINSRNFIPKDLKTQLDDAGKKYEAEINGNQLTITIGDETIIYSNVYSDDTDITINDKDPVNKETGGTAGIAKQIFDAVNRQLKRSVTKTESTIPQSEVQTVAPSDVRLKKNISKVGISPNGYNIYNFEYINQFKYGAGIYQGVMAQEVPHAQITVGDYYHVDYDKLDVTFKKI